MVSNSLGLRTLVPGWPLAIFRIAFGLLYLDFALQKAPWNNYGWLQGWIEKEIASPAFGWYATFLKEVVLPNFAFFGAMSFVTELALGLGLLLGFMTRLAGLGGFFWQVNIAVGSFNIPGEWVWIWPLLTLPQFCFAFSNAGRVLGVDGWMEPVLETRERAGASWARLLRHAT